MNSLMLGYIIFTIFLSIFNVHTINKNAYIEALVNYRIIDKPSKYSKIIFTLLVLDFMYFTASLLIALVLAVTGSILALFVFLYILVIHIASFLIADYKDKKKGKLITYALEKTDTPSSVIEFKVDAFLIEQSNPDYLYNDFTADIPKIKYNIDSIIPKLYAIYSKKMGRAFPLYKEFLGFMITLNDTSVDADSPLLNAHILENITLLSTVMSILKDEKLVKSLKSDLGKEELEDLTNSLLKVSTEITIISEYIKKEKITFSKATNSAEIIDGLNEIRSMKEFIDLVK